MLIRMGSDPLIWTKNDQEKKELRLLMINLKVDRQLIYFLDRLALNLIMILISENHMVAKYVWLSYAFHPVGNCQVDQNISKRVFSECIGSGRRIISSSKW